MSDTLLDLQYQFNTVNNITQMIDNSGTHGYSYDTLDRLTAATHPNQPNESYMYDDVGNRTASHQGSIYGYLAFNRLVSADGTSFGYDTNGNQTSKSDTSGSWTYLWDYENRLKQASLGSGVSVTYSYDALGRRAQRTSSVGGTEKFVYDGADVVRDLDAANATLAEYLNGRGIDNKLRQTTSGTASYFISDHLGSTRALADGNGNIASSLGYHSFGNVTSGSASTRHTYTGREIDFESGLMYYRSRSYDATQGRFVSEDPIGFKAGINFYAYVENNPLRYSDPTGLCPQKCADDETLNNLASGIIGGRLDRLTGIVRGYAGTYNSMVERLTTAQFEEFYINIHPDHWGGNDFQGFLNGNWYHVTVGRPHSNWQDGGLLGGNEFNPNSLPPFIQLHCEPHRPNSLEHFGKDLILPRVAPYLPLIPTLFRW